MPSSLQAQITRRAISPRFAIRILLNMYQTSVERTLLSAFLTLILKMQEIKNNTHVKGGGQECPPHTINFAAGSQTIPARTRSADRSPPTSSQSHLPRQPRSRSSASWLRQYKAPAPLQPRRPA